jgi:hypothetical protein
MKGEEMFVKWYEIETFTGVKKVQGLGEKFVAESLNRFGIKWDRPKSIKTPFGNYTPDFWCESAGVFIEVKGMRTALKMVGLVSLLENGRTKWAGTLYENSLKKMNWVRENVAPIDIYINDNPNDTKYKKYLKEFEDKVFDFEVIYGREGFLQMLRLDWYLHERKAEDVI